jgi:hypothetical protein
MARCRQVFENNEKEEFRLMKEFSGGTAQLRLSLDVIYYLIEDEIFDSYMEILFNSSERLVIIYSSNTDTNPRGQVDHVKNRNFTKWVEANKMKEKGFIWTTLLQGTRCA